MILITLRRNIYKYFVNTRKKMLERQVWKTFTRMTYHTVKRTTTSLPVIRNPYNRIKKTKL